MNRWSCKTVKVVLMLLSILGLVLPYAAFASTVRVITSGTTFTVPSDWDTTGVNTVECVGPGGNGVTA